MVICTAAKEAPRHSKIRDCAKILFKRMGLLGVHCMLFLDSFTKDLKKKCD
jgi:hypothetical protein